MGEDKEERRATKIRRGKEMVKEDSSLHSHAMEA